ncbi:hypothetical protein VTJ04DRAFT_8450 [Mycothermus thermophilus]|uniref:uncharacterized protein n=1 Tax=Humicola insolens TaxID=85995 RepID=UPI003742A47A
MFSGAGTRRANLKPPAGPALPNMAAIPKNLAVAPAWLGSASTAPFSSSISETSKKHSPTPGPIPTPAAHPIASPDAIDGQSRTIQGPSAKEWERHRETIIKLYKQYPLKRVSEIMRSQHGFVAR